MLRPVNVATPLTAARDSVPDMVMALPFCVPSMVICVVALVTTVPIGSMMLTVIVGSAALAATVGILVSKRRPVAVPTTVASLPHPASRTIKASAAARACEMEVVMASSMIAAGLPAATHACTAGRPCSWLPLHQGAYVLGQ